MRTDVKQLHSYLQGSWQPGEGDDIALLDPTTEQTVAVCKRAAGLEAATRWGREVGGPALRAMTFAERGELLAKMARVVTEHRDELLDLAAQNGGNTRGDGKFDVDGGTAVLASYAALAEDLPTSPWLVEDEPAHDSNMLCQSPGEPQFLLEDMAGTVGDVHALHGHQGFWLCRCPRSP